jgi:hypothetical protein
VNVMANWLIFQYYRIERWGDGGVKVPRPDECGR